jgi:hypothetical protein
MRSSRVARDGGATRRVRGAVVDGVDPCLEVVVVVVVVVEDGGAAAVVVGLKSGERSRAGGILTVLVEKYSCVETSGGKCGRP